MMTSDRAVTITASTVLAVTVTAATFAFATATPAPRQVFQSPISTLADTYLEAWSQLKESP
ncbi:hypothetical protein [Mycolicibacterium fortuitum]|uniref:hypothetical protein n=1 Tax=Mycolicibacterium fortuitum TaxID=1766 RepID=UPI001CDD43D3|nr:hypothetical protein [Mycolicibacterium fortuitum]UBV14957.1 hypothetical protein H8Z57_30465 [Mycolicibacterium fortuitum]